MQITLCQINSTLGDLNGNREKILQLTKQYQTSQLIIFPPHCLTGFPLLHLTHSQDFLKDVLDSTQLLVTQLSQYPTTIVFASLQTIQDITYDVLIATCQGKQQILYKQTLSGSYVGASEDTLTLSDNNILILQGLPNKNIDVTNVDIIMSLDAQSYHEGVHQEIVSSLTDVTQRTQLPMLWLNMVGGQDSSIFYGRSTVLDRQGQLVLELPHCQEDTHTIQWNSNIQPKLAQQNKTTYQQQNYQSQQLLYEALCMGVRDYVLKSGFTGVIIGLSGGIDSALTAALAIDALGKQNVDLLFMPSIYTSQLSYDLARQFAHNFSCPLSEVPIDDILQSFTQALDNLIGASTQKQLVEENLQARIRGTLLMGMSNAYGKLVLATANKSEAAMGYATLYGDMVGGFAPLVDLYKKDVWQLASWRNQLANIDVIPQQIISREPTAELKPQQKDSDTLPHYHNLDYVLQHLLELQQSPSQIVSLNDNLTPQLIHNVYNKLLHSEYKRQQATIGPQVTTHSLDKHRNFPISNSYLSK